MSVYKSKDYEIIHEHISKMRKELKEQEQFLNALERELVKGHTAQEELKEYKELENKDCESWDSISK